VSTERSQRDDERDDETPAGDSAGTYFISVEDFEARKPPFEREASGQAESGEKTQG
jgi:hypothetical protein